MFLVPYERDFFSAIDRPLSTFFDDSFLPSISQSFMQTDIVDKDGNYELKTELPGFKKEDIEIELKNGHIVISAKNKSETEEKNNEGTYLRRERRSGQYTRSFAAPENLKHEDIQAKFEDGILTLTFPKEEKQEQTKRLIDIQ